MKRIQSACLSQTVRFQQREPFPPQRALEANREEFERYQSQMRRSGTRYQVIEEKVLEDGTLEVNLKKQHNNYDYGSYMD